MTLTGVTYFGIGRALLAAFAMVANLLVAGVPVLHAWAHEMEHAHHAPGVEADGVEHPHDEIHPLALHDDCLLVQRTGTDFVAVLPAPGPTLTLVEGSFLPTFHPVPRAPSRAPPEADRARAPPLV